MNGEDLWSRVISGLSSYDRWVDGETGVGHEVSQKSRNTTYIFALISRFAN